MRLMPHEMRPPEEGSQAAFEGAAAEEGEIGRRKAA